MIRPIRAIAIEARLDATPAQVWHALTDASALEGAAPENFNVGFWLSTYGVEPHLVNELQRSLDDAVTRLVEPTVAATL